MVIKSFTRESVKSVSQDIVDLLKEYGEKHGLSITSDGGRFDDTSFKMKIKCDVLDDSGHIETEIEKNFKVYACQYGLKPEDLGETFIHNGQNFKIAGCKVPRRNTRYPIVGQEMFSERRFKFTAAVVKRGMGTDSPGIHVHLTTNKG